MNSDTVSLRYSFRYFFIRGHTFHYLLKSVALVGPQKIGFHAKSLIPSYLSIVRYLGQAKIEAGL